jgi:small subunit ribosomal protein S1
MSLGKKKIMSQLPSSTENFAELFEESMSTMALKPGALLDGLVVHINHDKKIVTIDTPLKSEGYIRLDEFLDKEGQIEIAVGDHVLVTVEAIEDGCGETRLSRTKAKRQESWKVLEEACEKQTIVSGMVVAKVKGGFTVDIQGIRAFLPGSLIDVRSMRDMNHLEGKELDFKIIKLDQKRNNVVVSRRSVESDQNPERERLLESLKEGVVISGTVKNLTDYGAFVDLGGIDGLLHLTDIAWDRVKHPSDMLTVGQELQVKVLRFDREKMRVSLGLKQLGADPWVGVTQRYPEGTKIRGEVTNIADYGCFVKLEAGIEGLVHVSEMDWTNRNVHPNKIVHIAEEIEVMVLELDEDRRRISLGLKQCKSSPWAAFSEQHAKGDRISGKIKSITDFGIFIGLDGNIDGLVHLSDISWNLSAEEAVKAFKKGDTLEAMVLSVDSERERISLGIKQLEHDPIAHYLSEHEKGTMVTGTVREVEAKGAVVLLAEGVEGYLRAQDLSYDVVDDARAHLVQGQAIEAKFISLDRKTRALSLSLRTKDESTSDADRREYIREEPSSNATIGDLLKEQMRQRDEE